MKSSNLKWTQHFFITVDFPRREHPNNRRGPHQRGRARGSGSQPVTRSLAAGRGRGVEAGEDCQDQEGEKERER